LKLGNLLAPIGFEQMSPTCPPPLAQRFGGRHLLQYHPGQRAVGPIAVPPGLAKSEVIAFASASLFFKTFQIHRAVDPEKNVLVYTVVSTKLINGSPFNSISVVPAGAQ
jgi:CreA protein